MRHEFGKELIPGSILASSSSFAGSPSRSVYIIRKKRSTKKSGYSSGGGVEGTRDDGEGRGCWFINTLLATFFPQCPLTPHHSAPRSSLSTSGMRKPLLPSFFTLAARGSRRPQPASSTETIRDISEGPKKKMKKKTKNFASVTRSPTKPAVRCFHSVSLLNRVKRVMWPSTYSQGFEACEPALGRPDGPLISTGCVYGAFHAPVSRRKRFTRLAYNKHLARALTDRERDPDKGKLKRIQV